MLGTGLGQVEEIAHLAKLVEEGAGHLEVEELRHAPREIVEALDPEGGRHAPGGAEGVDQDGHAEAADALEEEGDIAIGRPLRDAIGDLGDLQIARHGGGDPHDLPVLVQVGDELAKIGEGHGALGPHS